MHKHKNYSTERDNVIFQSPSVDRGGVQRMQVHQTLTADIWFTTKYVYFRKDRMNIICNIINNTLRDRRAEPSVLNVDFFSPTVLQ